MLRTGLGIIIKLTLAFFTIMTGNSFLPNDGDNSMQEWVKENAMEEDAGVCQWKCKPDAS